LIKKFPSVSEKMSENRRGVDSHCILHSTAYINLAAVTLRARP